MIDIPKMTDKELAAEVYEVLGWAKPPREAGLTYPLYHKYKDGNWHWDADHWEPVGIDPNQTAKVREAMRARGSVMVSQAGGGEYNWVRFRIGDIRGESDNCDYDRATFEAALMALRASQCSD